MHPGSEAVAIPAPDHTAFRLARLRRRLPQPAECELRSAARVWLPSAADGIRGSLMCASGLRDNSTPYLGETVSNEWTAGTARAQGRHLPAHLSAQMRARMGILCARGGQACRRLAANCLPTATEASAGCRRLNAVPVPPCLHCEAQWPLSRMICGVGAVTSTEREFVEPDAHPVHETGGNGDLPTGANAFQFPFRRCEVVVL